MTTDLTVDNVTALLRSLRNNRTVEYLCRGYLQFGPEAMSKADLAKLRDLVAARAKAGPR